MKLTFLGATETVTGSRHLLEVQNTRVLIDCGLFQGLKKYRELNWQGVPFDVSTLDAVAITHAHVDHTGYLPYLAKIGYTGPIYSTPATFDLCKVLLLDSAHLQEEEADFANKHGFSRHKPALPLYTVDDANAALALFVPKPFHQVFTIKDTVHITFFYGGHILGASWIRVSDGATDLVFSGDLGRPHDFLMRAPENLCKTDYLILESTYGNRRHEKEDPANLLKKEILETYQKKGVLVIPSFAVGRTQQMLYLIWRLKQKKQIPDIPVFLDSPMAIKATDIFRAHKDDHKLSDEETVLMCDVANYVRSVEDSKAIDQKEGPMIVISASGMASGGRVLHHLKAFLGDEKNTILFVGYQPAGTRGQAMVNGAEEVKIHGAYYPVNAKVIAIEGLSAHADCDELVAWIKKAPKVPRRVFLVHGEHLAQLELKQRLEEQLNLNVDIPKYRESVEL